MSAQELTEEGIDRLVDEYRDRCLWFLRRDFYPATLEERLRVLGYIERYGDRNGYQKAAQARRWLERASLEVLRAKAREEEAKALSSQKGMDLDDDEVMSRAWRQ